MLTIIIVIDIAAVIWLVTNNKLWAGKMIETFILFAGFIFILAIIYAYYDLNADKNLIKKAVSNGDVALAKINNGTFVRFGRDARMKNHTYWKLDVEIFDNDMNKIDATIIEKFATFQTSIPKGYVYITYNENKPDDSLIIPNVIIASIPEYKVLVDDYEKAIKPKYLNAYMHDGLVLRTYEESMKIQKDIEKPLD